MADGGPVRVTIRRAAPVDAAELTAIAHAAKRRWGYPERWIRRWRPALTVRPAFVRTHLVYCAVRLRHVVGFYALSRRGPRFELEHMWVLPEHSGFGIGRRLFRHAVRVARGEQGRVLEIASDPNAEAFYLGLGARRVGEMPSTPRPRRLPLLQLDLGARRPPRFEGEGIHEGSPDSRPRRRLRSRRTRRAGAGARHGADQSRGVRALSQ